MRISTRGRALIKAKEALRLTAYLPTPHDVPTIGWGHTGKDVRMGLVIDELSAEEDFEHDCLSVEGSISASVTISLNQNQFDALGCLLFNVGAGGFLRSHLRADINSGDLVKAKANWLNWDHQGSIELAGLKARREMEWNLFNEKENA